MNFALKTIGAALVLLTQAGNPQAVNAEAGTAEGIDPSVVATSDPGRDSDGAPGPASSSGVTRGNLGEDVSERLSTEAETARVGINQSDPNREEVSLPTLREFSTEHARYFPVSWLEIPDWHDGVTV